MCGTRTVSSGWLISGLTLGFKISVLKLQGQILFLTLIVCSVLLLGTDIILCVPVSLFVLPFSLSEHRSREKTLRKEFVLKKVKYPLLQLMQLRQWVYRKDFFSTSFLQHGKNEGLYYFLKD